MSQIHVWLATKTQTCCLPRRIGDNWRVQLEINAHGGPPGEPGRPSERKTLDLQRKSGDSNSQAVRPGRNIGRPSSSVWHSRGVLLGYILSYPRSGNHLARALIEYLSRRPTSSIYVIEDDHLGIAERFDAAALLGVDPGLAPEYVKVHRIAHLENRVDRSKPLIFILRDPFESISSDLRHIPQLIVWLTRRWPKEWAHFIENTREYVAWPGPKLLLYYEDMKSAPDASIRAIGEFLGVPEARIAEARTNFAAIAGVGLISLPRKSRSGSDVAFYRKRRWFSYQIVAPEDLRHLFARYDSVG